MSRKLETKELEEILETLFLTKFNHLDRYKKLTEIINKFGYKANSKYKKIMAKISKENLKNNK